MGGRDSRTDGGKGASGRRLEWQRRMEKEDTISVQWAQEDVETSYSLLNNNNNIQGVLKLKKIIPAPKGQLRHRRTAKKYKAET